MTHNPTPAEVQAAYEHIMDQWKDSPQSEIHDLLAAVARDSLGWREVKEEDVSEVDGGAARLQLNRENGVLIQRYFIKDAAP